MACRHTQLAVHANWGDSFRLGQCQRVGRILVVPRAGRRGGLGLAMTEIDSGLARELECVESQAVALRGSRAQRDCLVFNTQVFLTIRGMQDGAKVDLKF